MFVFGRVTIPRFNGRLGAVVDISQKTTVNGLPYKAIYTWYISGKKPANWVIIYYQPPFTRTRIIQQHRIFYFNKLADIKSFLGPWGLCRMPPRGASGTLGTPIWCAKNAHKSGRIFRVHHLESRI